MDVFLVISQCMHILCLAVSLSLCHSVHQFVRRYLCPSVIPSTSSSVGVSVPLSVRPSLSPSSCLSVSVRSDRSVALSVATIYRHLGSTSDALKNKDKLDKK